MKGLRKNERCPIHSRFDCCGREASKQMPRRNPIKGPVTRIPDQHHPRGYIERSARPLRCARLTHLKVKEQKGKCAECGKDFQDIREAVPDHIEPKGMRGQWRKGETITHRTSKGDVRSLQQREGQQEAMKKKKCNACSKVEGRTVMHPLYYFHRNASRPDGLTDECRFAAAKRGRGRELRNRFNGVKCLARL
jgi:hypothetical protein